LQKHTQTTTVSLSLQQTSTVCHTLSTSAAGCSEWDSRQKVAVNETVKLITLLLMLIRSRVFTYCVSYIKHL